MYKKHGNRRINTLILATFSHGADGGAFMGGGLDALPQSVRTIALDCFGHSRAGNASWLSLNRVYMEDICRTLGGGMTYTNGKLVYHVPRKLPASKIKAVCRMDDERAAVWGNK